MARVMLLPFLFRPTTRLLRVVRIPPLPVLALVDLEVRLAGAAHEHGLHLGDLRLIQEVLEREQPPHRLGRPHRDWGRGHAQLAAGRGRQAPGAEHAGLPLERGCTP